MDGKLWERKLIFTCGRRWPRRKGAACQERNRKAKERGVSAAARRGPSTEPLIEQPVADSSGTVLCKICGHPVDPHRMHPHMVRFHGVAIRARGRVGEDNPIQHGDGSTDGIARSERALRLEPGGAQAGFELAKVFGQFRGPAHARAWLVRMFEGKDFRVQCLAREINARVCWCPAPRTPGL